MTTLIRGSWVVAFDGEKHRLIKDGEVAYDDDRITYVGKNYQGAPDEVIEAKGRLISPGFINIHAVSNLCITHFRIDGAGKGGRGLPNRELLMKNLRNPTPYFSGKDLETGSLFSFVELLKGGSTTIVEITAFGTTGMQPLREQAELLSKTASELGARAYISHPYTDAKKFRNERGETEYYFDESLGLRALDDAVDFCKTHEKTSDDRIRTMLFPYMFDACSSGLLAETRRKADELNVPVHMHAAQYLPEYYESLRRYGKTPVNFLYDSGFLKPKTILTHLLFTSLNPHSPDPGTTIMNPRDINMLAETGTTLGHTPLVWIRVGLSLYSYAKFQDAGVNIGIGTDAWPMDMIMEMRSAVYAGKLNERSRTAVTARDVFNASTLGGAKALGRNDLGRLASGAKADIICIDLTGFHTALIDDPIKTLIYFANQNDVETVIVDGKTVVEDRKVPEIDHEKLAIEANEANQRYRLKSGVEYPWSFELL